ncbi:S41 family peptidase [Candidatus Viridilinea mediisalina]|uniref:PDZ domain-containing protein n=1 Tax=Candidatus Viridilinea mediisalina TaxID=2024553 RepID=A0A2A6RGR4_9CHLR|nr:S41 family peptidase [Candidatus Viridilinea mediisalina]PDW02079.1 hypothetical protein CJ255_15845 [Candidatus Viridilinea mediisalina]
MNRVLCVVIGSLVVLCLVGCAGSAPAAPAQLLEPTLVALATVEPAPLAPTPALTPTAGVSVSPTVLPPSAEPTQPALATMTPAPPTFEVTPTTVVTVASSIYIEAPDPPELDLGLRQQIFYEVWQIINTNYLYTDFGGVDWGAVREEFEPRIEQATSDERFYQEIEALVARLDDQHSRFLPPQAAERQDILSSGREEQVGIGAIYRDFGDGLLLQQVFPGGPAARAGLQPRDRIVAINGNFYRMGSLEGREGSEVRLTVVRPDEPNRDIVLTRARIEGQITPLAQRLPGEIGYLKITTLWVSDMDKQVGAALADLLEAQPLRGMIIDLRSNPGGWRSVMQGVLSHFTLGEVGAFTSRHGAIELNIASIADPDMRGIPLVVLVDQRTASYAELIAAILQSQAGAMVLGMPTAGNTETIYSYELTGGGRLWVAQEGFILPDGRDLEDVGVQPDLALPEDWTHFSEANDPGITTALRLLSPQAGGN